jgi:hypothetical protein
MVHPATNESSGNGKRCTDEKVRVNTRSQTQPNMLRRKVHPGASQTPSEESSRVTAGSGADLQESVTLLRDQPVGKRLAPLDPSTVDGTHGSVLCLLVVVGSELCLQGVHLSHRIGSSPRG